jgi:hypothetical protein
VVTTRDRVTAVIGFTVRNRTVVAINGLADPTRLARIDLSGFGRSTKPDAMGW